MQTLGHHCSTKQSVKWASKRKVWTGITVGWKKGSFSHFVNFSHGLSVGSNKPQCDNVSGPPPIVGSLDCSSTAIGRQTLKTVTPSPWNLQCILLFTILYHQVLLVTGGNCLLVCFLFSLVLFSPWHYFRDIRFIIWGCVWDSGSIIYVCYAVRSLVWYWLIHWHLREVWGIQQAFNNPVWEIKQNYGSLRFVLILLDFHHF